jgi:molybdopterin-guanine dinucleotide biosynthesis protein A
VNAVVLAGGTRDAVCAGTPGAPNKAFVPIAGRTLVERTLDALRTVPRIARIVVVAPAAALSEPALAAADERRPSGAQIADSLRLGVAGFAPDEHVLVATSDLPILTREAVDEFLDGVLARDCDIAYACVEKRVHEAAFVDVPHTWATLRDGCYCGGGLIALRPRAFPALERFLGRLAAARKNPLRLASIFGYDVLARYALRMLRVADAEARASSLLGASVCAIPCAHAEIAVNVDRPGDVAIAERLVARRQDQRLNDSFAMPN